MPLPLGIGRTKERSQPNARAYRLTRQLRAGRIKIGKANAMGSSCGQSPSPWVPFSSGGELVVELRYLEDALGGAKDVMICCDKKPGIDHRSSDHRVPRSIQHCRSVDPRAQWNKARPPLFANLHASRCEL